MRRFMLSSPRVLIWPVVLLVLAGCPSSEPSEEQLGIVTTSLPSGIVGAPYAVALEASGGGGDLHWSADGASIPRGLALSESGRLEGSPTGTGTHALAVEVRDGAGALAKATIPLEIFDPLQLNAEVLPEAQTGEFYSASLFVSGGKRPYAFAVVNGQLPAGLSFEGASLAGTPTESGLSEFVIEAADASGQRSRAFFAVTVNAGVLRFTAPKLADVLLGEVVNVQLAAIGGKRPISYEVAAGTLPPGVSLSTSGRLSGTTSAAGSFSWNVRVRDASAPPAQLEASMSLRVLPALKVSTTALREAVQGEAYSETLTAVGGRAPLRWRLVSNPGGVPVALSAQGSLTGTPTTTGTFALTVEVADADNRTDTASLPLTVLPSLSITTASLPDAYRNEAWSKQLTISGTGAATWSISAGALPAGLSLSSSGMLSGVPGALGASTFTVRAVRDGRETTRTLTLTTYAAPSMQNAALADAYVGTALSSQLAATGGKPPMSFSASGTLPPGLSLSSSGLLSGTPSAAGAFQFTVSAADGNGRSVQASLSLDVARQPELTGASLPDAIVGQSYSQQLLGAHGHAPLTYSVSSGTLPRGITLASTGLLSGYGARAGTSSFSVKVTDANGRSAQASFSLKTRVASGGVSSVKVVGWNLQWFGDSTDGPPRSGSGFDPTDDALQIANARTVLLSGGWELAALVEIVDAADFQSLVGGMSDYSAVLANDFWVSGGSSSYHASEQKPALLWRTSAFQVVSAQVILAGACPLSSTDSRDAFAGRPPLEVVLQTTGSPATTLNVYVVHLKAFATADSRNFREVSSGCLKSYLDGLPAGRRALVVGDFNDDVDVSTAGGPTPFANFVNSSSYSFPTASLSTSGYSSTVFNSSMIDHQLINAALVPNYVAGSAAVVRPDQQGIGDYSGTTSDHYPVEARYSFGSGSGGSAPYVFINEVRYSEAASYDEEFVEVVNAGDATADLSGWTLRDSSFTRHVFPAGTSLAPGKAIVVFGGASAIPSGLSNAMASSSASLSLHPSDSITLSDGSGTTVDGHAWSFNLAPGASDNRSPDGVPGRPFSQSAATPGLQADGSAF